MKNKKTKKKSDEENQEEQWLKILSPDQMLSRLSIFLAQLKAVSNSENHLKNKIRQILHYLYRSKKLTKQSINFWIVLRNNGNNLYEH